MNDINELEQRTSIDKENNIMRADLLNFSIFQE